MANNFNEYLKENLSCVDVVKNYVNLEKRGANYICNCPFHDEKTASFTVSPKRNSWKCFGCNEGGDAVGFIMKYEKVNYVDALKVIKNKFHLDDKEIDNRINSFDETNGIKNRLFDEMGKFMKMSNLVLTKKNQLINENELKEVLEYLHKRGITNENIEKFKIGYIPKKGVIHASELKDVFKDSKATLNDLGILNEKGQEIFKGRVLFPLKSVFNDKVVGLVGRAIDGSEPKYLVSKNTEIFEKNNAYFGNIDKTNGNNCGIVEGIFDEISMFNLGMENSIAILGTSISDNQIDFLKRNGQENAIISPDNDNAGFDACVGVSKKLYDNNFSVFVKDVPNKYKDMNEFYVNEINTNNKDKRDFIIDSQYSKSFNEWIIDKEYDELDKDASKPEKIANIKKAMNRINEYSYDVYTINDDLNKLATLYDVDYDYLKSKIKVYQNSDNKKLWMLQEKFAELVQENEYLTNYKNCVEREILKKNINNENEKPKVVERER